MHTMIINLYTFVGTGTIAKTSNFESTALMTYYNVLALPPLLYV